MGEKFNNLIRAIYEMNKRELDEAFELVNDIIKYNYNDENTISHLFDKMLSIEFINEKVLKKPYYKLLKHARKKDINIRYYYLIFYVRN